MNYYFSIADFFYNYNINIGLLNLIRDFPYMINDGIVIDSIYGCFPNAVWNGGRTILGGSDAKNVEDTLKSINDRGISCRYTFTNCLLEKKHLDDTWCNLLLEKANNGMNAVILNSDILNDYIKEKYPEMPRISSTTKGIYSVDEFNKECEKDYSLCVLHYTINNDFDTLKKIKYPEKVELVANDACTPHCPMREKHYEIIAKAQLEFRTPEFDCTRKYTSYAEVLNLPQYISYEDIVTKYAPMGFTHFKLIGRTGGKQDVIESYVQYFIKPEYQMEARLRLLPKFR